MTRLEPTSPSSHAGVLHTPQDVKPNDAQTGEREHGFGGRLVGARRRIIRGWGLEGLMIQRRATKQ